MRPRWRKVLSDLIDNKARTILVVLSIAVGVFAIGVIAGAYRIISDDMSVSYAANNPSNIELRMDDFDEDFLNTIRKFDGIKEAEARRVFNIRARPLGETQWTSIDVVTLEDFEANKVNLLVPISGKEIPLKNEILLERDVLEKMDAAPGDTLEVQLRDNSIKLITVTGIVQDSSTGAVDFLAPPLAYISTDTLKLFDQPELFNRVFATVETGQDDDEHINIVLSALKEKIEKNDYEVGRTFRSLTHQHPLENTINAILGILMALGVLIVFLSSSLIANTLSALLNQHLRHIGVMKLIGGRDKTIFKMYLVLLVVFGILALLIAVPAGGQGAYGLAQFIANKMGFLLLGYRIVPSALFIQIAVGLLVPLIAGFVPVINGSRVTVQKAISGDLAGESSEQAEGGAKRESRIEEIQFKATRMLADRGIRIKRPLLISLRNTFRRRGRLMLTLFTLTMGGATFISVFNVRVTLHEYVKDVGNYFLADVTLDFDTPYRVSEIEQFARQDPRVTHVEGWAFSGADILYPNGSTADNVSILAPPAGSDLVEPLMVSGRWVEAGDEKKLAISEGIFDLYPDLKVGDYLPLKVNGKEESWEVVGIFKFIGMEGILGYAPYEYISRDQNMANRSFSYRVVTKQHDRAYQEVMAEDLDAYFRDKGFHVQEATPGLSTLDSASESLDILISFLLIMALLTAVVGSMGLAGTMSMNVLERTREIGIMRAIGATDIRIITMVLVEGLLIGVISFVLGIFLAVPFTYGLSFIVSQAVFETPIAVVFTPMGYGIWFGLVIILSTLASVLPARSAARLTIREVLAYE
ncbi:MAG: ABC transporter permease [Anaerolineae bacterium]|jgi:putative ABC transport system permease protein|nr:ABC transporter permease [Anaerolineae bacterium]MBT3713059.1 ABC transporter permease [Anaerolineae bacterium]MBT4309684.1 ABC transporter permease [Anaerolineae bacterium]MBT4459422.1 ABC transporter permease [Anaerolineae bacterium]MBT4842022.1 ABC transporter permease [Anaerolineae bacterium]